MGLFGGPEKKKVVEVDGKKIELEKKPSGLSKIFGGKPAEPKPAPAAQNVQAQSDIFQPVKPEKKQEPVSKPAWNPLGAKPQAPPAQKQEQQSAATQKPVGKSNIFSGIMGSKPKQPEPPKAQKPIWSPQASAPTFQQTPPQPPLTPQPPASPNIDSYRQQPQMSQSDAVKSAAAMYGHTKEYGPVKGNKENFFRHLVEGLAAKQKNLETDLRKTGIKTSPYEFVRNMLIYSIILSVIIGVVAFIVFLKILPSDTAAFVLAPLVGGACLMTAFRAFLNFPGSRERASSKNIERDILFASRDMIISLRSGMQLFNAITSISSGYGDASKEFLKIVEKVQLGTPLEDAIDQVVEDSKSPSFKKIMLQASVSIKVGADITAALQSVIDQLSQERVIELRRYGQRLNAIAMFYMLFGIIVPSMGIAVMTILTTFISLFSVTFTLLEAMLIFLVFLQIIFLKLITSSRPVFTM